MKPPPLDYRVPSEAIARRRFFSFSGLIGGGILSLYLLWMLVRTAKYAEIYRDFNLTLPTATALWIDLTGWLGEKAFYLPLLFPPLIGAFTLPLADRLMSRDPARSMRAMLAVSVVLLLILTLVVLQDALLGSPMIGLFSGMGGGNNKR